MDELRIECPWCGKDKIYWFENGDGECENCLNPITNSYKLWLLEDQQISVKK